MASDKDRLFEKIYFLWKGEGMKRNSSIDWYCERYGEVCRKRLQDINHLVMKIQVVGRPGRPEVPRQEAVAAEEAMCHLRKRRSQQHRLLLLRVTQARSEACHCFTDDQLRQRPSHDPQGDVR